MPHRSIFHSLKHRLGILLALLAVFPALAVGLTAYNLMFDEIRSQQVTKVGRIADTKHAQLVMMLKHAKNGSRSLLSNVSVQCGGHAGKLNEACAARLIGSYLISEGALGATLHREDGADIAVGAAPAWNDQDLKLRTGQLAKFSGTGTEHNTSYFVLATDRSAGLRLAVSYPSSSLQTVFDRPPELGVSGETFLVDADGYFVTNARYPSVQGHGESISARPMRACLGGHNGDVLDLDYRDARIIHGFRFVPEFGSACIMAHIDQAEAFAPIKLLEKSSATVFLIFLVPVVMAALYIARRIAKAEAALQGTLSLNQNILTTSPAGFAAYRTDGQCVMANPACCKTVGGSQVQMLRQNFRRLESWRESGMLDCADRVLSTGLDMEREIRLTTSFGRQVWLHCHFSRFSTQGALHLLVMLHDITEARRAEQALKASEEFNRRIIASSSDCIQVLDLDGNLISMSEGGQRLLEIDGVSRYLGSSWVNFWQEHDRGAVAAAIGAARRGEAGRFAAYRPTEKGAPKWWDVVVSPIASPSGQVERLLAVSRDVTGRKEEEEQFELMIRTSLDGFWITDERGRFLEVNDAYCHLIGYRREEMLEMTIPAVEAIETPEETARHIQELMQSGSVRFETRHRCKDGRILDVEVSAKHTPKYGGKIYCFVRDITARKHTEKMLEHQRTCLEMEVRRRTAELIQANEALEASFREADDLYQNAPCGYHSLDRDGTIVRINDAELKMLGYARDELQGRRMQELLTPEGLAAFKENFPRLKERGHLNGVETEVMRKDGSTLPVMVNVSAVRDEHGGFLMSRAAMYDMTEQRQAEQARLRLNRARRLLSEGNAALIHARDEQGLLESICRLVVETGGYLMSWVGFAEHDAGKSVRPVARFGDNDGYVDGINICWADTERGRGPTGMAIRLGTTQINQNWRSNRILQRWFAAAQKRGYQSSIALPIVCEGRTLGALNMYSGDPGAFVPEEVLLLEELASNLAFGIEAMRVRAREAEANKELGTYRMHLELLVARRTEELSDAKIEAERANNAKSRFLAAASHDLRQPLTALTLYVGVLKHKLDAENGELLTSMEECIGGLSSLLSKLLDLSKLDAGVVKPRVSSFALDDLLNKVFAAHAPDAEANGLRLRCRYGGLTARTDSVLFQRIIGNLLGNAVRYTLRGGVLIGCRRFNGKMWVEIWDTGIGIPPDKTGEIFEEFKQLGDAARTHGSGLGLTIVARTAELLGLQIRVRSRLNRGSMFAIELPLGRKAQAEAQPKTRRSGDGLRIALVDDNSIVLDALACGLKSGGHDVVAAASGSGLLDRLGSAAPDVAVCDYRLAAGETGFDVIEAVRAAFGDGIPAVIITGDTDPQLMRGMARKGIVILHKPVELEDLEERIEEAMNRPAVSAA